MRAASARTGSSPTTNSANCERRVGKGAQFARRAHLIARGGTAFRLRRDAFAHPTEPHETQLATNSSDLSEFASSAAAVSPKYSLSPGLRLAPSTIRLLRR